MENSLISVREIARSYRTALLLACINCHTHNFRKIIVDGKTKFQCRVCEKIYDVEKMEDLKFRDEVER